MAKRQVTDFVFRPGIAGQGTIKILDKVQLNRVLLITNTTTNQILYNFSDPDNQITVSFTETTDGSDPDFPYANTISNGVTTFTLLFDTSTQSSTDSLQIFVEDDEVRFRPYNFGTDAIERMRVATPQSMLDADFEYGLQPTKWQTVDLMRGYPSIFEVPGSDITLEDITTNASSTTGGVGDSLITVTCAEFHGLEAGNAIRMLGLLDTVSGSSRAAGSFVVNNVVDNNTFTYFAKGKVGTVNGTTLLTTFTQLRRGGFYTGSAVGSPTFTLESQGSIGQFNTNLGIATGSNRIPTTGIGSVTIGAFLTGSTALPTGTQVTGIANTNSTKTLAADVTAPSNTLIVNGNTNGIEIGSALDNGNGDAIFVTNIVGNELTLSDSMLVNKTGDSDQIGIRTATPHNFGQGSGEPLFVVNKIDGGYTSEFAQIQKTITGSAGTTHINVNDVLGIFVGQKVTGAGLDSGQIVQSFLGISTVVLALPHSGTINGTATFTKPGIGYTPGDRIIIPGSNLNGTSPNNDLVVRVDSVDGLGGITSVTSNKTMSVGGSAVLSGVQFKEAPTSLLLDPTDGSVDFVETGSHVDFAFGTGAFTIDFFVYRNRNNSTEFLYDGRTSATDPAPLIFIDSSNFVNYNFNGSDVISGITTVEAGTWHHIALSKRVIGVGTQPKEHSTALFVDGVLQGLFDEGTSPTAYPERPVKVGARYDNVFGYYGYLDALRITKGLARYVGITTGETAFDASSGIRNNDYYNVLLCRFNGQNGTTTVNDEAYGVPPASTQSFVVAGVTPQSGTGQMFGVTRIGGSSPSYNVFINQPGENFAPNDTIFFDGSIIGGNSVVNDLTLTVQTVGGGGDILTFSQVGTASSGNSVFLGRTGSNSGIGASFSISKSDGNYQVAVAQSGTGYYPDYELKILGTELGNTGATPTNDLIITVADINKEPVDYVNGGIVGVSAAGSPVIGDSINFTQSVTLSETTTDRIEPVTTINFSSLARILVTFASKHGLVPGDTALISVTSSGANHALAAGPRLIDAVPELNQLVYTVSSPGTVTSGITGNVFPRPDCFYTHRPFDGGVQLGTGGPAHGAHAIRQSKKYLRYQSGKGIMYTTGTLFAPAYDLRSVSAAGIGTGSVITVVTDDTEHGLQVGAEIQLSNLTTSGYNGHYLVNSIVDETTFTVLSTGMLGDTTATIGPQAQISLYKWKGATVRAGAFDDQNGIFWQYDGVNLSVGLRSATFQLAGSVGITTESNSVTGTNTRFREQLIVGNRIVIRGMTHTVTHIESNTQMTVTPDYRGVKDVSATKAALINEIVIPQSQWNIDKADGTGASGYTIEVNKMQMIGFQYTWYGAGFIDWMLRGPNGDYLYVHRLKNNNRNTEAFMRSGNLPVRYEVINEGAKTRLTQNVGIGSTVVFVDDVSLLPSNGSLYVDNEIINYTGVTTSNSLTGVTRGATFTNFYSGSNRSYTAGVTTDHSTGTGVVLLSNTATPVISHWGSAFLTDGLFDDDRGYIFNYQAASFSIDQTRNTAFLIRLAPSVSNAIIGDLGDRELINRAQLLLQGIEFTATGGSSSQGVIIEGILNPQNYPDDPNNITWAGLSNAAAGGQPSFAQIAPGTSVTWTGPANSFTATNGPFTQNYRTSFVYFVSSTVAGVKVGQQVSGTGVPGGTTVSRIYNNFNYGGQQVRAIGFSQSVNNPGTAGNTTYTFTEPTSAANPGETVFSFIGSGGGGNTAGLDLTSLKELNNTPIGGRGTFPNGPDVLAINVYTTSGNAFTGNLVLRWSEAQA